MYVVIYDKDSLDPLHTLFMNKDVVESMGTALFDSLFVSKRITESTFYMKLSNISRIKLVDTSKFKFESFDTSAKTIEYSPINDDTDHKSSIISTTLSDSTLGFTKHPLRLLKPEVDTLFLFSSDYIDEDMINDLYSLNSDYDESEMYITKGLSDKMTVDVKDFKYRIDSSLKKSNEYIFDLNILTELTLIDRKREKLYIVKVPTGVDMKTIGIDYTKMRLVAGEIIDNKIAIKDCRITTKPIELAMIEYCFGNCMLITKEDAINDECLNTFNNNLLAFYGITDGMKVYNL